MSAVHAVLTAPRTLRLAAATRPEPAAGQVLVRVGHAGICGTDLHNFTGDNPFLTLPRIMGHELAGWIEVGNDRFSPGDPVVIDPMITCGHCRPCRLGRRNCCVDMKVIGVHVDGGYQPYLAVDASQVHPLPANLPVAVGALVEPLTIGAQATERGRVGPGETVLIQGAGAIGLCCLLLAKVRGARVLIADALPGRLALARELGADEVISLVDDDVADKVARLTGGEGPGVVIEAAGRTDALRQALDLVAAAGTVVTLLISTAEITFPVTSLLVKKELDLVGSRLNRDQFAPVIDLLASGRLDPAPLISHRFPLDRAPEAFALCLDRPGETVKVLLEVAGS